MKNTSIIPVSVGIIFFAALVCEAAPKQEDKYADCMDLAEKAPDKAINMALVWQGEMGGVPARHCEAYGLFIGGDYMEAAARMETIAEDMRVGRDMPVRGGKRMVATGVMLADMYKQAATAWLLAEEIIRAETAIDIALSLTSSDSNQEADLLVLRARIAAADEDFAPALKDLKKVYAQDEQRKNLLVLIASAARGVGDIAQAQTSITEYLKIYPDNSDGYLEHGNLMDMTGNREAARKSWLRVIELSPEGPDAVAARKNLERIDVATGK